MFQNIVLIGFLAAFALVGCQSAQQKPPADISADAYSQMDAKSFDKCYVYCPEHGSLSDCMKDREKLAQIKGDHNIAKHNSKPIAQIYKCGSTTQPCDP